MTVHKPCVIITITIIVFFLNACAPFPVIRLSRHSRETDDAMGNDSTKEASSTATMNAQQETFVADENQRFQVQEYLERNGYLPLQLVFGPVYRVSDENFSAALQSFQRFVHLPATGILDEETFSLIVASRCGVPDLAGQQAPGTSGTGYTTWARWTKLDLTYRILSRPHTIEEGALRGIVTSAMEMWMEVTPLSLCEELDPEASVDINIRHKRGEHGDGVAFDGLGGALGHAFLPNSGEIHLDLDEDWTIVRGAESNGTDYLSVLAHEIGHALGLLHSGVEGSIMFPFFTQKESRSSLCVRDISSIQSLYGNADDCEDVQHRCRARTTTPQTSTSPPIDLLETMATSSPSSSTVVPS